MNTSIYSLINRLVSYGVNTGLIEAEDRVYTANRLMEIFNMDAPDSEYSVELTKDNEENLEEIEDEMDTVRAKIEELKGSATEE